MDRRTFLGTWAGGLLAAPLAAEAQQAARTPRIGVLGAAPFEFDAAFKHGLAQSGYVSGQNVAIDYRQPGSKPESLHALAAELVRLKVDVVLARGPGALVAASAATTTIPIIALDLESDPVAMGFVRALAHPGGNITGIFLDLPELSGKHLQLLKEVVHDLAHVAVLGDAALNAAQFRATETAARSLSVQLQIFDVRAPQDLAGAFDAAKRGHAGAVVALSSPFVFNQRNRFGALAVEKRLPIISLFVEFAEAGGLMAYGPSLRDAYRACGVQVARVLRGARPADLPVERPARFELVINMKTAKALGLTIPPSLLLRADEVIQ